MATKPLVGRQWATQFSTGGPSGNPNRQEPPQAFRDFGQPEAGPVDRQSLNYQFNSLQLWSEWSEQSIDDLENLTDGVGIWIIVNNINTNLTLRREYLVLSNTSAVDLTLPSTLVTGNPVRVYHPRGSTNNTVRILNNGHTLIGNSVTLSSADNLVLEEGYYVEIIPTSANVAYLRITPMEV